MRTAKERDIPEESQFPVSPPVRCWAGTGRCRAGGCRDRAGTGPRLVATGPGLAGSRPGPDRGWYIPVVTWPAQVTQILVGHRQICDPRVWISNWWDL